MDTAADFSVTIKLSMLILRTRRGDERYKYYELDGEFKQLDAEYFQQHGDELSKNKELFNAVFRAGLNSPQLRDELGLDN